MGGFFIALAVFVVLFGAIGWHLRRGAPVREGAAVTSIDELTESGRHRIRGTILAEHPLESPHDGVPCVFFEHADYTPSMGSQTVLREVQRWTEGCDFYVDDGTGRVRVDPTEACIEAAVLVEDAGLTAERRLRVGEEIEVTGRFALTSVPSAPYREAAREWHSVPDEYGGPAVTYRTIPDMLTPIDETGTFFRATSMFILAIASILGLLLSLVG